MHIETSVRFRIWITIVSLIGLVLILWHTRWTALHEMVSGSVDDKPRQTDRLSARMTTPPAAVLKRQRLESHPSDLRGDDIETKSDGAEITGDTDATADAETTSAAESSRWTVEILVTDWVSRTRLGGATVSIEPVYSEKRIVATCKTDSEGSCQVTLGSGTYMAAAEHALYHRDWTAIARPLLSGAAAKVELALRRKVRIHGVVRNQFGEPVPRAKVVFNAYRPADVSGWFGRGRATSDEEGLFECHVVEGQFEANANKAGHKEWTGNIVVTGEDPPPVLVTLEETSPVFRVSGNVFDQLKHPIPGAQICVEMDVEGEKHFVRYADSDQEGFYSCDIERGETTFLVRVKGFDEMRAVVDVEQDLKLDFSLRELPGFKIRVLDWNGKIVSNVRLHGTLPDGSWRRRGGRWILGPGRQPDTFDSIIYPFLLHVDALDSGAGIAPPILVREYRPEIVVQLEQGGHIVGRVVNTTNEVVVEFGLDINGPDGIVAYKWRHSQDGSFRLDHLPPGDYWITVEGDGPEVATKFVSIEVGQTAIVDVVLKERRRART